MEAQEGWQNQAASKKRCNDYWGVRVKVEALVFDSLESKSGPNFIAEWTQTSSIFIYFKLQPQFLFHKLGKDISVYLLG